MILPVPPLNSSPRSGFSKFLSIEALLTLKEIMKSSFTCGPLFAEKQQGQTQFVSPCHLIHTKWPLPNSPPLSNRTDMLFGLCYTCLHVMGSLPGTLLSLLASRVSSFFFSFLLFLKEKTHTLSPCSSQFQCVKTFSGFVLQF